MIKSLPSYLRLVRAILQENSDGQVVSATFHEAERRRLQYHGYATYQPSSNSVAAQFAKRVQCRQLGNSTHTKIAIVEADHNSAIRLDWANHSTVPGPDCIIVAGLEALL